MATDVEKTAARAEAELAESAKVQEQSAKKQVRSTLRQEDSAERRTRLAANRTLLAAERTYAAWMRTGLAALAAGIGAKALLDSLIEPWLVLTSSIVLILFSEFCFVAGVWRELTGNTAPPEPDTPRLRAWVLIVFNGFLLLLGLAVLIGIVTR